MGTCPSCGRSGRAVNPVTVATLATKKILERLTSTAGFHFCATEDCEVVWFQPSSGILIPRDDCRVRVGLKDGPGPRPLCYCFGHTVEELEADIRTRGYSAIPAEISAKCRQGLGRCEENNPRGSCCLGDVNRVMQTALRSAGAPAPTDHPFILAEETADPNDDSPAG